MNAMTMTLEGATNLKVVRRFDARPEAVFDAHTQEDIIKRWLLPPPGWTMPECTLDGRPGGAFSYTWAHEDEGSFTIRGKFLELNRPSRILHEEVMEMGEDTPPMSKVETLFEPDGDGTLMTMTITYDSTASRDAAVASGMEEGMAYSYDNLEAALTSG